MVMFKKIIKSFFLVSVSSLFIIWVAALIFPSGKDIYLAQCTYAISDFESSDEQALRVHYEKKMQPILINAIGKEFVDAYPGMLDGIINRQFLENKQLYKKSSIAKKMWVYVTCKF